MNTVDPAEQYAMPELADVLNEHDRWLRTALLARLHGFGEVDEVMQETAAAALSNWHQLKDPSAAGPWLYKIAIRQALLYRRKQGRIRKLQDNIQQRLPPAETTEANPVEWLLAEERNQLVRRAMHDLPRRDAEVLLLKYTEQWSYKQIGQHMGISASAVESRLHRARTRLREKLLALEPALPIA